jgi:hypothetical protein
LLREHVVNGGVQKIHVLLRGHAVLIRFAGGAIKPASTIRIGVYLVELSLERGIAAAKHTLNHAIDIADRFEAFDPAEDRTRLDLGSDRNVEALVNQIAEHADRKFRETDPPRAIGVMNQPVV